MSEAKDWPAEARARYPLGSNVTYPSRAAAENVRHFINELASAYERLLLLYQTTCSVYCREHEELAALRDAAKSQSTEGGE